MKKLLLFCTGFAAATLEAATPVVSDVTMTQNSSTREVTITYKLSAVPAIVTLDVQTNYQDGAEVKWASIGAGNIKNVAGDAFVRISEKKENDLYTISWHPEASWPGHVVPVGGARAVVKAHDLCDGPLFLTVDLTAGANPSVHYYPSADSLPHPATDDAYKTTTLLLKRISARNVTFPMGSFGEAGSAKETQHPALLTDDYYIGVYPITQSQWQRVKGSNPAYWKTQGEKRPVENVTFSMIRTSAASTYAAAYDYPNAPHDDSFLGKLNALTGKVMGFDLPSEAQWEYAAKAGNPDGFYGRADSPYTVKADGTVDADRTIPVANTIGRYKRNGGQVNWATPATTVGPDNASALVGTYQPNDWGIYDMGGNVGEWCLDWWQEDITGLNGRPNVNGQKKLDGSDGSAKAIRGANVMGFEAEYTQIRPSFRDGSADPGTAQNWHHLGFRVVCSGCEKTAP